MTKKDLHASYDDILQYCFAVLSRRAHSEKELRDKIDKRYAEPRLETIDQVIKRLQELNFVNDAEYASTVTRLKLSEGKGHRWLSQYLKCKGLAQTVIEEVLTDQCDDDTQKATAHSIAQKKYHQLLKQETDQYKRKTKLFAFLARRGFDYRLCEDIWKDL